MKTPSTELMDILEVIAQLNEQLLDALVLSASTVGSPFPLPAALRSNFADLPGEHRRRVARCGIALADGAFGDPQRWRSADPLIQRDSRSAAEHCMDWLPSSQGVGLAHSVMTVAWLTVHTRPYLTGVLLGMHDAVAGIFQRLSILEVSHLAWSYSTWIRPRWANRMDIWKGVLQAAAVPSDRLRARLTLRCLKASVDPTTLAALSFKSAA